MGRVLDGLHYSPWTERARWSLDHHGVAYRYREHVPMLGEPLLRWRARGAGDAVRSVPLLRDARGVYGDSMEIMWRAEEIGSGSALLGARAADVQAWARRVNEVIHATRARVIARTIADPDALRESALAVTPAPLASAARPISALGARYLARKHRVATHDAAAEDALLGAALDALREALARGQGYVLGESFSGADIVAAGLLQGVQPCDAPHLALRPATRRVWSHAHAAAEYADLIAWRDQLYATHR